MKNNIIRWFEGIEDVMFSDKFQSIAIIVIFAIWGIMCFIGAFWNPILLMYAGGCAIMVLCGLTEFKKCDK